MQHGLSDFTCPIEKIFGSTRITFRVFVHTDSTLIIKERALYGTIWRKTRTRIGKWLDARGITQEWLATKTKIHRGTISKIASDKNYSPTLPTIKKIMKVLREVDPGAKADDFFDM
jgi:DNA-binding XRE family transcriptional regulator